MTALLKTRVNVLHMHQFIHTLHCQKADDSGLALGGCKGRISSRIRDATPSNDFQVIMPAQLAGVIDWKHLPVRQLQVNESGGVLPCPAKSEQIGRIPACAPGALATREHTSEK
jgi:hypothetical protein